MWFCFNRSTCFCFEQDLGALLLVLLLCWFCRIFLQEQCPEQILLDHCLTLKLVKTLSEMETRFAFSIWVLVGKHWDISAFHLSWVEAWQKQELARIISMSTNVQHVTASRATRQTVIPLPFGYSPHPLVSLSLLLVLVTEIPQLGR